jgi:hypothetical protein
MLQNIVRKFEAWRTNAGTDQDGRPLIRPDGRSLTGTPERPGLGDSSAVKGVMPLPDAKVGIPDRCPRRLLQQKSAQCRHRTDTRAHAPPDNKTIHDYTTKLFLATVAALEAGVQP